MATALSAARMGDTTARTWTVKADGSAANLTGITSVTLYYRYGPHGQWHATANTDTAPMQVVTTAASGVLTFTPNDTFFSEKCTMYLYLKVDAAADYTVPDAGSVDYYTITVTEGY